jgi:Peptidase family S41
MDAKLTFSSFLVVAALSARAQEPAGLSQDEMQQMLRALRTDYAAPEAVSYESLNRAAIDGLLKANPRTMQLVKADGTAAEPGKLLSAVLADGMVALRPAEFTAPGIKTVQETLAKLAAEAPGAILILDLRAPCRDASPAEAAALLSLFFAKGTALFTSGQPAVTTGDPLWSGEVIALVDEESCNVAEIAAAVFKFQKRAWLAGSLTRGRLAEVKELPLREGLRLRYTAQRVQIEGQPDLFGKGVEPDQTLPFDAEAKRAAFTLQQTEGLTSAVFIPVRPRQNEAALLARGNVELPDRITRSSGQLSRFDTAPVDTVMQLAADIVTARRVLTK